MTSAVLKRQLITDAAGDPVGVILPIEEFMRIEKLLARHAPAFQADKMAQMEQAAHDPLFLADLQETMMDFAHIDADWGHAGASWKMRACDSESWKRSDSS